MNSDEWLKYAMFPATGGDNQLVVQSCISVTDFSSTDAPRYWSYLARRTPVQYLRLQ